MTDDDPLLLELLQKQREEEMKENEAEIEIGGTSDEMEAFLSEYLAAKQQQELVERGGQPELTSKQQKFSEREVSPYFSNARNTPLENRLREIAQTIKRKPNVPDGNARRTKQPTFTTIFRDSGNDEADESGYYTATAGNADEAGTKVNRSWYAPKNIDQFMQPAGGETVYDKSERRAMELRSKRKQ